MRTLKALTLIFGIVLLTVMSSSCKKCQVCTAVDEDNNAVFTYPEVCGTNSDIEAYKSRCEAEYGSYDFVCSCGERE